MNIIGKAITTQSYDVIVIGSGISGGWAAKEFCDLGFRTLVLERGRPVKHVKDYPTAGYNPWDMSARGALSREIRDENPIAGRCYAFDDATKHFFVKDSEHPYVQEKPFDWIRGYQEGGKSLIWARQTQRWSNFEFEAPARDGFAVDWPIRYQDLEKWYSHVEHFVGISGNRDGLVNLPDSEVLPAWELNCLERHIQKSIQSNFPDRPVITGRCAHLTEPKPIHIAQGRGKCQARNLCYRGCPYGAYFSSNTSTLPWAEKTGNLTIRTHSTVHSIIYDQERKRATGVRVVDTESGTATEFYAKVIFVNASTLNTNLILLNSKSGRFPNGLGNDNGLLGKYIAFHNYRGSIVAQYDGFGEFYYKGRRPTMAIMPSFRNVHRQEMDFQRGYLVAFEAARPNWNRPDTLAAAPGRELKDMISKPGSWQVYMMMQGETLPKENNHVRLSKGQTDKWGIPLLVTSVDYDENDEKMLADFLEQGALMLEQSGCINISPSDSGQAPGLDIHEMGGVRMGHDPETSLLNRWNQLHLVPNVFVTDGACMTSVGNQNPSLTFMAITARAANHAANLLKRQEI